MDKQKVYSEIRSLGERITPEDVLNYARNENTELHKCFEWDDGTAGEKFRLVQAQNLIIKLKITISTAEPQSVDLKVRAYESVIIDGKNKYVYTPAILESGDYSEQLIGDIMKSIAELKAKLRKYQQIIGENREIREALHELAV